MNFAYDLHKSAANLLKHGIDFEEAKELWNNRTVSVPSTADLEEPRWLVMGRIRGLNWTAIVARRSETTRLISVRRSRKNESQFYEEKCKDHNEGT